ncbi:MAG: hypothetical protein R3B06_17715 [Kofleriaceae bacterium]
MRGPLAAVVVVAAIASAAPARAYRFEVTARTVTDLAQLPALRLVGGELSLSRRRFHQDVAVTVWDVGDLAARRAQRRPGAAATGPTVWFTGDLQLDHDFGAWTLGAVALDGGRDALDVIPELRGEAVALTVPYGYLAVDGVGGRVDVRLGRLLRFDEFGGSGLDGVAARIRTAAPIAVEVEAGLRVRDRSPLAVLGSDLDGTAGVDCREYVEAPTPGQGSWQLIDRSRAPSGTRLGSDQAYCPERSTSQPTVEVAVTTDRLRWLDARLAYRRTQARTVGVIGAVDRLDVADVGLYPNERGQAPAWGVTQEHLSASARATGRRGRLRYEPWGLVRYSLVHGAFERLGAGVQVQRGAHQLEPTVARTRPSLDADSIWSVFAISPSLDVRLAYQYRVDAGRRLRAESWVRRYDSDGDLVAATAGGASLAGELAVTRRVRAAAELVADDGYGGRRLGGTASARWQARRDLQVTGRAGLVAVAGSGPRTDGTTASLAGGAAWQLDDGIALTAVADVVTSPLSTLAVRTLAVLDLAFEPDF